MAKAEIAARTVIRGTTEQPDGDWDLPQMPKRLDQLKRMIRLRHRHQPERVVWPDPQAHGSMVIKITDQDGPVGPGDALVTDQPNVLLTVRTADCIPVFLEHPKAVGLVHAGLAGVAEGILPAAIEALTKYRLAPSDLTVHFGPHICSSCYEMSDKNRAFLMSYPETEKFVTKRGGRQYFSLLDALTDQIGQAGIKRLTADSRCTYHSAGLFSSRRGHPHRVLSYLMLAPIHPSHA